MFLPSLRAAKYITFPSIFSLSSHVLHGVSMVPGCEIWVLHIPACAGLPRRHACRYGNSYYYSAFHLARALHRTAFPPTTLPSSRFFAPLLPAPPFAASFCRCTAFSPCAPLARLTRWAYAAGRAAGRGLNVAKARDVAVWQRREQRHHGRSAGRSLLLNPLSPVTPVLLLRTLPPVNAPRCARGAAGPVTCLALNAHYLPTHHTSF